MSQKINQPINQVRLTNVATVRMNKGGKRFEIACYRNKVVNYRQGIETDLSEVLQTERVFTNVSKGEFSKSKDLKKVFGTTDEEAIIELILTKGDLQVSDLERSQQYESMNREIATWISEHGVHPVTQRPYTIPQIRQAMKQSRYIIHPTRSMKKQYLECFKKIQEKDVIKIVRAKMKLKLTFPENKWSTIDEVFGANSMQVETDEEQCQDAKSRIATLLVDPSLYRTLENLAKEVNGRLEILKHVVMREGDSRLEEEIRQNQKQQNLAGNDDNHVPAKYQDNKLSLQVDVELKEKPLEPISDRKIIQAIDHDSSDEYASMRSMRKDQNRAQKKSKKAKRREKGKDKERQMHFEVEEDKRRDRAVTKNINDETNALTTASSSESRSCNTCGGSFTNMNLYRAHFRSDWHRYNIKLKLKGLAPVSDKEFSLCDADAFFSSM